MRDDVVDPFPEEWELLSLFECEPKLEEGDIPWAYDRLTFDSTRGSNRILCLIEPIYERLDFTWWHNQTKHLELKLRWVQGITISSGGGIDCMVATFRDSFLEPLRLQLKPTIECEWGTTRDCP